MKLKHTIHHKLHKHIATLCIIALLMIYSAFVTGVDWISILRNTDQMAAFLSNFLKPDWKYLPHLIFPMLKTIQLAVAGTAVGTILAVPAAFLGTTVVTGNSWITGFVRFIMNVVRTIPNLLLAALFVSILGIGEVTGVITVAIFTFGILFQLIYEAIENIDVLPLEAAESVGANRIQISVWSILPQISHHIAGYILYAFEINIRASTVLGYVGAGGIGVILNSSLGLFRYDRVSVIILFILMVVFLIDGLSEYTRKRLL